MFNYDVIQLNGYIHYNRWVPSNNRLPNLTLRVL